LLTDDDDPINNANRDSVVSTVFSTTFTVTPGDVAPSSVSGQSLLYIDLETDVALLQGESYAFHFRPDVDLNDYVSPSGPAALLRRNRGRKLQRRFRPSDKRPVLWHRRRVPAAITQLGQH
jgi:hypothetical protein